MKRDVRLYNVLFPIWLMLMIPSYLWIGMIPANLLIDLIALTLTFKITKVRGLKETLKKTLLKVWLLGFAADLIGCLFLFLSQADFGDWWYEFITAPVSGNPYDNWFSLAFTAFSVLLSGFFIYLFNIRVSFNRVDLERKKKRKISLLLAILTMPYILLIPSQLFYSPGSEIHYFTNHIVSFTGNTSNIRQFNSKNEQTAEATIYTGTGLLIDAINYAQYIGGTLPDVADESYYSLEFRALSLYSTEETVPKDVSVGLFFSPDSTVVYFHHNYSWYRASDSDGKAIADLVDGLKKDGFTYNYTIVDNTVVANEIPELIAKDAKNYYYLSSQRAQYIMICFENQDVLSLREALGAGIVSVPDLIRHGLSVITVPADQAKTSAVK